MVERTTLDRVVAGSIPAGGFRLWSGRNNGIHLLPHLVSLIVKTPVIINDRYTYRIGNVGTMPYTGNPVVGPYLKMESKF